jgi:hypothetical protein
VQNSVLVSNLVHSTLKVNELEAILKKVFVSVLTITRTVPYTFSLTHTLFCIAKAWSRYFYWYLESSCPTCWKTCCPRRKQIRATQEIMCVSSGHSSGLSFYFCFTSFP